jgi:hypothetical protein
MCVCERERERLDSRLVILFRLFVEQKITPFLLCLLCFGHYPSSSFFIYNTKFRRRFKMKTARRIMSRNTIIILVYHRHKSLRLIPLSEVCTHLLFPKHQSLILKLEKKPDLNFTSHGRVQCHSSGSYLAASHAAARVQSQVNSCEFSDGRSGSWARFLRVLWFPLQILIQPLLHFSGTTIHVSVTGFGPRSGHVGFMVDKVALGQVFSEYLGFTCRSSFRQLLHNHHHLSSGAGTIGQ